MHSPHPKEPSSASTFTNVMLRGLLLSCGSGYCRGKASIRAIFMIVVCLNGSEVYMSGGICTARSRIGVAPTFSNACSVFGGTVTPSPTEIETLPSGK